LDQSVKSKSRFIKKDNYLIKMYKRSKRRHKKPIGRFLIQYQISLIKKEPIKEPITARPAS